LDVTLKTRKNLALYFLPRKINFSNLEIQTNLLEFVDLTALFSDKET
jgi:hypothetical protein